MTLTRAPTERGRKAECPFLGGHEGLQFRDLGGIRAEKRIVLDGVPVHDLVGAQRTQLREPTLDFDPEFDSQPLAGHSARGDAHGGLPRRGAAAPTIVANTVLFPVGVVRVPRTELPRDVIVIARPGIGVFDQQGDRGAGAAPFEHARKDLHIVRLAPLRCVPTAPGRPSLQFGLDLAGFDFQPRRATVNDAANGRAVAFTEGRDPKQSSKRVMRHFFLP